MRISPQSDKPDTRRDLSAVTVVEIDDPTAVGEAIEVIEQDAVQLESKPLRVHRVIVRLCASVVLFQPCSAWPDCVTRLRCRVQARVGFFAPPEQDPARGEHRQRHEPECGLGRAIEVCGQP